MRSFARLLMMTMMLGGFAISLAACGDTWRGVKEDTGDNLEKTGDTIEKAGEAVKP